jgi:hypothetical protein
MLDYARKNTDFDQPQIVDLLEWLLEMADQYEGVKEKIKFH